MSNSTKISVVPWTVFPRTWMTRPAYCFSCLQGFCDFLWANNSINDITTDMAHEYAEVIAWDNWNLGNKHFSK